MAVPIQVTFDCADPDRLAHFWADLLGYALDSPPPGFDSWEDWLREQGIPESEWNSASAVSDPEGHGPRIFFQRVPEQKQQKNRVHLDVNAGGPRARRRTPSRRPRSRHRPWRHHGPLRRGARRAALVMQDPEARLPAVARVRTRRSRCLDPPGKQVPRSLSRMPTPQDADPRPPDDAAALTSLLRSWMPFAEALGLEAERGAADEVIVRGEWAPERCTAGGVLHGGYLMALADSTGAACAVFNLPPDSITSTIESKTNFFRPVTEGSVQVRSTPVHVGRTTIVVQTDVTRADGALVTRTTQTQAVLPAKRT